MLKAAELTFASCSSDTDDCRNNSCQSGSTCDDKFNGYECICPPGLKGIYCQSSEYQGMSEHQAKANSLGTGEGLIIRYT